MKNIHYLLLTLWTLSCQSSTNRDIKLYWNSNDVEVFAPKIISTHRAQRDLAISPDGTVILSTESTPANGFRAIIQVDLDSGKVKNQEVAGFSGNHNDIEPFFAPDGRLYFSSDRPIGPEDSIPDYNIWSTIMKGRKWLEPVPLPENINTNGNEFYPSLAANGNLYFTASYQPGYEFIWLAKPLNPGYEDPERLDSAINSSRYQFNAYVSPEEDYIIFSSYGRPDGYGGGDLYISKKGSDGWQPAQNLGPEINSDKLEFCPFVDQVNKVFYFTSNKDVKPGTPVNYKSLLSVSDSTVNGMGSVYRCKSELILNP